MENEKDIIRGFNAGYQLEKHEPELAQQLLSGFVDHDHPYVQGFLSGMSEYVVERSNEISKQRGLSQDQQQEKGLDFDP